MNWNGKRVTYRFEQCLIVLAHLLLLWWILYALNTMGPLPVEQVLLHFLGMAIYGTFLIRGTAYWSQKRSPPRDSGDGDDDDS